MPWESGLLDEGGSLKKQMPFLIVCSPKERKEEEKKRGRKEEREGGRKRGREGARKERRKEREGGKKGREGKILL